MITAEHILFTLHAYPGDIDRCLQLMEFIAELTPQNNSKALIVTTKDLTQMRPDDCQRLVHLAGRVFKGGVEHLEVRAEDVNRPKWAPQNRAFKTVANHVRVNRKKDVAGFLYYEGDCCPLHPQWWNLLVAEFLKCGKPFMGVVRPTRREIEGKVDFLGNHMNGCAFYPRDWHINAKSLNTPPDDLPFDVASQYEVLNQAHNTPLMSVDFRTDWDMEKLSLIPGTSVSHHGDKEGLLVPLMRQKLLDKADPTPKPTPAPVAVIYKRCASSEPPAPLSSDMGSSQTVEPPEPELRTTHSAYDEILVKQLELLLSTAHNREYVWRELE